MVYINTHGHKPTHTCSPTEETGEVLLGGKVQLYKKISTQFVSFANF